MKRHNAKRMEFLNHASRSSIDSRAIDRDQHSLKKWTQIILTQKTPASGHGCGLLALLLRLRSTGASSVARVGSLSMKAHYSTEAPKHTAQSRLNLHLSCDIPLHKKREWRQKSREVCIRANGFCPECGAPDEGSTQLSAHHHVYRRKENGDKQDYHDYSNEDLEPLCWPCHKEKERILAEIVRPYFSRAKILAIRAFFSALDGTHAKERHDGLHLDNLTEMVKSATGVADHQIVKFSPSSLCGFGDGQEVQEAA